MKQQLLSTINFFNKLFFTACVFVSPLIFFTDMTRNPFNIQTCVLVCCVAALLFLWAAKVFITREITLKYSLIDILFLAFIFVACFSFGLNMFLTGDLHPLGNELLKRGHVLFTNAFAAYFFAKAFEVYNGSEHEEFTNLPIILFWCFAWLAYPVFKMKGIIDIYAGLVWVLGFFLCFRILRKNTIKAVCDIFIGVGALAAFYGVLQNLGIDIFWKVDISSEFGSRAVSTFGNPNFLSSYLVLFLPLSLIYFMKAKKGLAQMSYFAVVILYCAYLVISMTRSSWIGMFVSFPVLFAFKDVRGIFATQKKRAALIFITMLFVFFAFPAQSSESYSSAVVSRVKEAAAVSAKDRLTLNVNEAAVNQAYHQRLMMWACGFDMLKKAPVLGQGWGAYQLRYAACQGDLIAKYPNLKSLRTQANSAHNEFVEVAAQSGILGLLFYISFFAALVYLFLKNYKALNARQHIFYAALLAGLAAMLADNMLNITLQTSVLAFVFWFVVSGVGLTFSKKSVKKVSIVLSCVLLLTCALGAHVILRWQIKKYVADVYSYSAHKFYAQERYSKAVDFAKKSVKLSKENPESFYTLVNSFIKLNKYEDARIVSEQAVKYMPHYHEFLFRLYSINQAQGHGADAFKYLKEVLTLYPEYYPAAKIYAFSLAQGGAPPSPQDLLLLGKSAKALDYTADIKLALAQVYYRLSEYPLARGAALEALQRDPFNPDTLDLLKEINNNLNIKNDADFEKAVMLRDLKNALKDVSKLPADFESGLISFAGQNQNDLSAAMILAEFYFKKGEYAKSAQTLSGVYESNKNNAALNFALSSSYQMAGEGQKAAFYLRHILDLDPFNDIAFERLSKLKNKVS